MKSVQRTLITVLFLLAAIACYVFGIPAGGAAFLVLGIVFEGLFWIRLLRRKRDPA